MLRADASSDAFLRNTYLEALVRRSGLALDVQASTPVRLYINAEDRGLYRAMAPKDAQWILKEHAVEAIDLVEGPGLRALNGSRSALVDGLTELERGAPIDTLERHFDLRSLIDLACMDIYTGRADHDINVRCWRERGSAGRWRWILFDQDLWPDATENSVARMCSVEGPEAPYLNELLRHPALRAALLARYAALMSTAANPQRAARSLDSIFACNAPLLRIDQERWGTVLDLKTPEESIADMHRFTKMRPRSSMEHLARATGQRLRPMRITVVPDGGGTLLVEGSGTDLFDGPVFEDAPLQVRIIPAEGMEFVEWKGTDATGPGILVHPGKDKVLRAVLRAVGTSNGDGLQQTGKDLLTIHVP